MKLIIHVEVELDTNRSSDCIASALEETFPSTTALMLEYGELERAERTVTVGGTLVRF